MKAIRITSPEDSLFETAWSLYTGSFPLCEQRMERDQAKVLQDRRYHFTLFFENERFTGLIGYWEFEEYVYIEHYAIDPTLRGGGYGSRILGEFIREAGRPVILEIDPVEDELSMKRLRFYQRLGFASNPYEHRLPRYRSGEEHQEMFLHILTYPQPIETALYERFNEDLHKIIVNHA